MTLQDRLDCQYSITDDTPDLKCEFGMKCDGTVYDCCLWDKDEKFIMENMKE